MYGSPCLGFASIKLRNLLDGLLSAPVAPSSVSLCFILMTCSFARLGLIEGFSTMEFSAMEFSNTACVGKFQQCEFLSYGRDIPFLFMHGGSSLGE